MDQKAFNKRWNEVGRSLGLVEPVREGVLTELGQGAALGAVSGLRGFASTLEELGGPAGPRKYFDAVLATNQQWNPDPDYTALSLNPANIARTVGTGAGQTATLLPAIAAGTAVGGPVGTGLVGTAVFAQTYGDNLKDYRERFKDRYSENEIRAMSFGRTLVDSAIETGLGSVPLAGKSIRALINGKAADAVARNAIKEASKKFGKATVVKALNNGFTRAVGKGALGEGGEEALQYIQDVIWRSVAGDPSAVLNWGELAENTAAGAWAGAAFGAVDAGTGRMAQRDRAAMPPIDVAEAVSPAWMKHYGVKDDSGAELAGLVASAPEGMFPADFTIVQPKSRAAKAVDAIGRELGLDIRYFVPMTENGAALNGVFARDSDAIYLDAAGTSRNPMQSLGHEFAHYLGKQAPDLANVWEQALNSAANPEARAAEETALRETYGELGEAGAEFSADRMGDMFTDPGMWSRAVQLAEAKQAGFGAKLLKVIDRFISAVKRQLVKFKSSEVEKFITDMDTAREAAAGVVAEFKRRQAGMLVPTESTRKHENARESTEAGTQPPFEAFRELRRRQTEEAGRMAGMLAPAEEHGLARTGAEGTDEHGSGADGHRPPKEGTDGADNIYLRMPLERVRQDAAHGVKLAQEALKELEAQETAAEPEPAAEIPAITEDEFLASRGVGAPVSDYLLDKLRANKSLATERGRKRFLKEAAEAQKSHAEAREQVRKEYRELVDSGKIRNKTAIEQSLTTAHGHPDLESTQAARRILAKKGIDWKTGEKITSEKQEALKERGAQTAPEVKTPEQKSAEPTPISEETQKAANQVFEELTNGKKIVVKDDNGVHEYEITRWPGEDEVYSIIAAGDKKRRNKFASRDTVTRLIGILGNKFAVLDKEAESAPRAEPYLTVKYDVPFPYKLNGFYTIEQEIERYQNEIDELKAKGKEAPSGHYKQLKLLKGISEQAKSSYNNAVMQYWSDNDRRAYNEFLERQKQKEIDAAMSESNSEPDKPEPVPAVARLAGVGSTAEIVERLKNGERLTIETKVKTDAGSAENISIYASRRPDGKFSIVTGRGNGADNLTAAQLRKKLDRMKFENPEESSARFEPAEKREADYKTWDDNGNWKLSKSSGEIAEDFTAALDAGKRLAVDTARGRYGIVKQDERYLVNSPDGKIYSYSRGGIGRFLVDRITSNNPKVKVTLAEEPVAPMMLTDVSKLKVGDRAAFGQSTEYPALYTGEVVSIGRRNVKLKTQSRMYGEQIITMPLDTYKGHYPAESLAKSAKKAEYSLSRKPVNIRDFQEMPSAENPKLLRNWLKQFYRGKAQPVNRDTGWRISVPGTGIEETLNHLYKKRGEYPRDLHYRTLPYIAEMLENARHDYDTAVQEGKKGDMVSYFNVPVEFPNGELYNARLVIKHFGDNKNYYDHKLTEFEALSIQRLRSEEPGPHDNASGSNITDSGEKSSGGAEYSLAQKPRQQVNPVLSNEDIRREYAEELGRNTYTPETVAEWDRKAVDWITRQGGVAGAVEAILHDTEHNDRHVASLVRRHVMNSDVFAKLDEDSRAKLETHHAFTGTEWGREGVARRLAALTLDSVAKVRALFDKLHADLPDKEKTELRNKVLDETGVDIFKLPKDIADNRRKLDAVLRSELAARSSRGDQLYEFWINSILSGPATHVRNVVGNTLNTAYELGPKRAVEAAVNLAVRNPKGATFGEMREMWKHLDWKTAWERAVEAFDLEVLNPSGKYNDHAGVAIGGRKGRIIRIPGRLLRAADEFCKGLIAPVEAAAYAYREGRAQKLSGQELADFINARIKDGNSRASQWGELRARELAFQEEPGAAVRWLVSLKNSNSPAGKIARFIFPFVQAPGNLLRQGVRKSPLGMASLLAVDLPRAIRSREVTPEMMARAAEQLIAWSTLVALWSAQDGGDDDRPLLTGSGAPYGSNERNFKANKFPPLSVRIGDRYYTYKFFEPLSSGLAVIANGLEAMRAKRPAEAKKALVGMSGFIAEKSYLASVKELFEFFQDPEHSGTRFATNFAASWVPNAYRQAVNAFDDKVRDNRTRARGLKYFTDQFDIVTNSAGFTRALPKLDYFGREVDKDAYADSPAGPLMRLLSVQSAASDRSMDQADRLLWNYNRRNPESAYWPGLPSYYLKQGNRTLYIEGEDYAAFARDAGQLAHKAILSEIRSGSLNVKNPGEEDVKRIKTLFTKARQTAKEKYKGKFHE